MSGAGTVLATSAEGAGDMPSLEQSGGTNAVGDGSPTFSEVLSLSSPDLPEPSGTSAQPATADADPRTNAAATPGSEGASPASVGSPGRRGSRRADPSGARQRQSRSASGPAAARTDRTKKSGAVTPATSASTQAGTVDVETEQGPAAGLVAAGTPAAVTAPATDVPAVVGTDATEASTVLAAGENAGNATGAASHVLTNAPHDGHVSSDDAPGNDGPSNPDPLDEAASATKGLETPDEGSNLDVVPSNSTSTVQGPRQPVASAPVRVSADRAALVGTGALHVGSEPVGVPGSAAVATATATASTPGAAGAGASAAAPVSPEGVSERAEFSDGGAGTAAPTVDIDDLAASISRPLAGGNGDYSVQVSLHPPELGEVRALLSLQGDVLHVTLTPEHASGYDALSDAMPALHEQLAGGGVEVNVTLGQPGDTQGEDGWRAGTCRPLDERPLRRSDSGRHAVGLPCQRRRRRPDQPRPVNATEPREQP